MLNNNILLVANYAPGVGGISSHIDALAEQLKKEGKQVDIFSTKGGQLWRIARFVQLLFRARHYSIIHVHGSSLRGMLPAVYGIVAGRLWHKKVVFTYHGGDNTHFLEHYAGALRRWAKRADQTIVQSAYLQQLFSQYNIPCSVVPNFCATPPAFCSEKEGLRLLSVRQFKPTYNIPCILRAFTRVKQQFPSATLSLLGDGPERAHIEQMISDLSLLDVEIVGQVDATDVVRQMQQSTILLSAPHFDNMPMSLIEAMFAGCLVISSNVGGVPYMIEDRRNGLLFPDDDDAALAERIAWAATHPTEQKQIIAAAREDAMRLYTWQAVSGLLY